MIEVGSTDLPSLGSFGLAEDGVAESVDFLPGLEVEDRGDGRVEDLGFLGGEDG